MKDNAYLLASRLGEMLHKRNLLLATAESCTGGFVAEVITSVPNCSCYFERGFVTYSNASKVEMLGVNKETISSYGAVSEPVAKEMAIGAVKNSFAHVSLAITGIAGPTGGTSEKPVGTVFFAWVLPGCVIKASKQFFSGDRESIRLQAVTFSLTWLVKLLDEL